MKIGLDTNDDFIANLVKNALKSKKGLIVDMALERNISIGNEVFEKVIIANNSSLDFYLKVEVRRGKENIKIYNGCLEKSEKFSNMFFKEIYESGISKVNLYNGENYYLIKNIKVPVVIIKIYMNDDSKISKKEISNKIIKCIKSI